MLLQFPVFPSPVLVAEEIQLLMKDFTSEEFCSLSRFSGLKKKDIIITTSNRSTEFQTSNENLTANAFLEFKVLVAVF